MSERGSFSADKCRTENGVASFRLCLSPMFCCSYFRRSCRFFSLHYRWTLLYILLWYSLSIAVILLNDWFMRKYGFDFPIYISICHMITTFIGSSLLKSPEKVEGVFLSRKNKLIYLGIMALFFGGDITFGNIAFDYMPVTSVQVINSSSTLIVLLLSLLLRYEKFEFLIALSVLGIVTGSITSSIQEIEGDTLGYLFAIISTIFSACKAMLIATLLIPRGGFTPLQLLSSITPPVMLALMPAFTWLELPKIICMHERHSYFPIMSIVVIDSLLAFCLNWTAFKLISATSALTYEVTGNFKEVIVFAAALFFFRDRLSLLNIIGNVTLVTFVILYSLTRMLGSDGSEYTSEPSTPDLQSPFSSFGTVLDEDDDPIITEVHLEEK